MNEIAVAENAAVARPTSLMEVISRAAQDPTVDVEKMERLFALLERQQKSEAERAYADAMNRCQLEMPSVVKDKKGDKGFYATLEAVSDAINPIFRGHGLSLSYGSIPNSDKEYATVTCTVRHVGGHSEQHTLTGKLDMWGPKGEANKTAIQGLGSSVSYLRRYLKLMIFDVVIAGEDKDGSRNVAKITQDQCDNLRALISEAGMDEAAQKNMFTLAACNKLSDLRADQYQMIFQMVQAKIRGKK